MFSRLIIATGNEGKYREFCEIIRDVAGENFADEIIFAPEISRMIVDETGKTYAENSMLKARAWAEKSGCACLADDSGLEVDALNGAPGLYSARVINGGDSDKVSWLLGQLEGVENRRARFAAALCLCVPEKLSTPREAMTVSDMTPCFCLTVTISRLRNCPAMSKIKSHTELTHSKS